MKATLLLLVAFAVICCYSGAPPVLAAATPSQTYCQLQSAIRGARSLTELYQFFTKGYKVQWDHGSEQDRHAVLMDYKRNWVDAPRIQAETNDGDTAEIVGTGWCWIDKHRHPVQVWADFVREDNDWRVLHFRADPVKSPFDSRFR